MSVMAISPLDHAWVAVAILFALPWLTYWDALSGQWVIDDNVGMAPYDGKLQRPVSWGNLFKKFRWLFGRKPNPNKTWQRDKQSPTVSNPRAHHRLSLWLLGGVAGLLYSFLARLWGPGLAFYATLLFVVYPLGAQVTAWISGVNYLMGAFWMLLGFNGLYLAQDAGWLAEPLSCLLVLIGYGLVQWLAVEAQFAMAGACVILAWLGWWPAAAIAFLAATQSCFTAFRDAVLLRKATFKAQNMDAATRFHPRKLIVVVKTLGYYAYLMVFPKRMGLYHPFYYHYELPEVEWENKDFWWGLTVLAAWGVGLALGPPLIQFALLWAMAYLVLFMNWVTAHQFVTERYAWLPGFGVCLLVAAYAPVPVYWALFGIALMRTWAHLPTYYNESLFYYSNIWNFPQSEIALGNLGVAHMGRGMIGTAMDLWATGTVLNPEYDVNWYNLASLFKSRGPTNPNYMPQLQQLVPKEVLEHAYTKDPSRSHLHIARYFLQRAVNAKTCHFAEPWKQEVLDIEKMLSQPLTPVVTGTP